MKTKVLLGFLLFFSLILVSFSDPYAIKRISDANFRYEFYTSDKKIKIKDHKTYYWFKGGAIHSAESGIAGALLTDKFVKMYHSNQLAEQGEFKNGLKVGLWKTWHPNGKIESTLKWKKGFKSGLFVRYDENGFLAETGKYNNDLKTGKWIDYQKKDTLVYKKGIVIPKKQKLSRSQEYKLQEEQTQLEQSRKDAKELENTSDLNTLASYKTATKEKEKAEKEKQQKQKEIEKQKRASEKASQKATGKDSKVKSFFKNIFKKKQ